MLTWYLTESLRSRGVVLLAFIWNDPWWRSLYSYISTIVIKYGKVTVALKNASKTWGIFLLLCG